MLFLSLHVVLLLVLLLSGLLTSLVGLFIRGNHQLVLGPFGNDETSLLLLGCPSSSFLLLTLESALPLLVDLFVQVRAQFVIDGFVVENSLDQGFEHIDKVNLAFGMIVDLDFEVSQQFEGMNLFDDKALVIVDQVTVLLADASALSSATVLTCIRF